RGLSWGVLVLFAGASFVVAGDLGAVTAKQKIALQKITGEVNQAIKDAKDLARKDPERAVEVLKAFVSKVDDHPDLTDDLRQPLRSRLKAGIEQVRTAARAANPVGPLPVIKGGKTGDDKKKIVDDAKDKIGSIKGGLAGDKKLQMEREAA